MRTRSSAFFVAFAALTASASAALYIDFDNDGTTPLEGQESGGPRTQAGFQSYAYGHERDGEYPQREYEATFRVPTTVSIQPRWSNTSDRRVRQLIDRAASNDNNWNNANNDINLLTDWIGIDARVGGGGNGDYDGVNGTPTYLTLTLGGLVPGYYTMTSFHHDTENINTYFNIEVSVDGGGTFTPLVTGARMTASTGNGTPAVTPTTGPDAYSLSSTQTYSFIAGEDDVVLRYTPLVNSNAAAGGGTHQTFFGINGFVLVPEPSSALMVMTGLVGLIYRRRR
jgi:hypothetical protein